jgi:hypothetical protein
MPGRAKGKKNLTYEKGKIVNQHGVKFTDEEKKALESLVNSANRKRKRMLEEEKNLPLIIKGRNTGRTLGQTTSLMGKESDFILAKKSKSLQRFQSKDEYKKYIKNLKKVVDRDYVEKRAEQYKKNHIKALRNAFGGKAKDLVKALKDMPTKDYMKAVQSDEGLEIGYIYDPAQANIKLEQIKASLGLSKNTKKK